MGVVVMFSNDAKSVYRRNRMTKQKAIEILEEVKELDDSIYSYEPMYMEALETVIKALKEKQILLGEELRKFRGTIKDKNTLIGFNMAIAICNKYLGETE